MEPANDLYVKAAYSQPSATLAASRIAKDLVKGICVHCLRQLAHRANCPCLRKKIFKIYDPKAALSKKSSEPSPRSPIDKMAISFITNK